MHWIAICSVLSALCSLAATAALPWMLVDVDHAQAHLSALGKRQHWPAFSRHSGRISKSYRPNASPASSIESSSYGGRGGGYSQPMSFAPLDPSPGGKGAESGSDHTSGSSATGGPGEMSSSGSTEAPAIEGAAAKGGKGGALSGNSASATGAVLENKGTGVKVENKGETVFCLLCYVTASGATQGGKATNDPSETAPKQQQQQSSGWSWLWSGSSGKQSKTVEAKEGKEGGKLIDPHASAAERRVTGYRRRNSQRSRRATDHLI